MHIYTAKVRTPARATKSLDFLQERLLGASPLEGASATSMAIPTVSSQALASAQESMSGRDHINRNPIVRVPSSVVEFDLQIGKVFLEGIEYPPEVLFLSLTQFRGGVQVKGHRLVPSAILMLN